MRTLALKLIETLGQSGERITANFSSVNDLSLFSGNTTSTSPQLTAKESDLVTVTYLV